MSTWFHFINKVEYALCGCCEIQEIVIHICCLTLWYSFSGQAAHSYIQSQQNCTHLQLNILTQKVNGPEIVTILVKTQEKNIFSYYLLRV